MPKNKAPLIFFLFFLYSTTSFAQPPYAITIHLLKDELRNYTIEDMDKDEVNSKFVLITSETSIIDNIHAAYWLKLQIKNSLHEQLVLTSNFLFQDFELFIPSQNGQYILKQSGLSIPFANREIRYKDCVFEIPNSKNEIETYYVRVTSNLNTGIGFPIYNFKDYWNHTLYNYSYYYFILGVVLLIGIYNLILFLVLKENVYLFFCTYVFSFAIFAIVDWGLLKQFYWGNEIQWSKDFWTAPFCSMTISLLLYSSNFLNTKYTLPLVHKILYGLIIVRLVLFITGFIFKVELFYEAYWDLAFLTVPYSIGFIRFFQGFRPARYFILGFTVLFTGYFLHVLLINGIIDNNPFLALNNFVVLWITLFSLAIGDRFRTLKKANDLFNQKTIEQLKQNDILKNKLTQDLEEKVQERTKEIERINLLLEEKNRALEHDVINVTTARVMNKDVTFQEFKIIYPDDEACLRWLAELKWAEGFHCRKCQYNKSIAGNTPYSIRCKNCWYIETVKSFTLFNNLRFPILKAFYMVFLLSSGKSATGDELSDLLELRKQTCLGFKKKVLAVMEERKYFKKHLDGWSHLIITDKEEIS